MDRKARKVSLYGMLLALSLVLSYVEACIPISLGVPGVKLGLPNVVTVLALYALGAASAAAIASLRIVLAAAMFGNMMSLAYAFCGFLLSFLGMLFLKRAGGVSRTVISIAGGVLHNVGQLLVAILLLRSVHLLSYLSVLLPAGIVSGAFIGLLAGLLLQRLPWAFLTGQQA